MLKKILAFALMLYAAVSFAAVDVNKATAADLDGIKGIGPAISGRIVDERKKGNFKDWNDFIERVKGVGEGNAAKFSSEGLTVDGNAFKAAATKPAAAKPAAAAAPAAPATPAAAAPAATEKKDPKAEAKMKADEAKAKKAADKQAKADAKKAKADAAKPAASAASAPKK